MTRQTTHYQVKSLSLGNIIGRPVRVTMFCKNAPTIWDQQHNTHLNIHVFHHSSHVQFTTYSQFESSFHILNITIYTKDYHNLGTKTPQIILHNYIKIIGRNIQISRAQFIKQFSLEHQYFIYNHKGKIAI